MALGRLKVIQRHLGQFGDLRAEKCFSISSDVQSHANNYNFKLTLDNPRLNIEQRAFYEKNGYILIPNLFDDDLLDTCVSRFIDLCEGKVPKGNLTLMKDISLMKTGAKGQYLYNKAQEIAFDEVFEKYIFSDKLLDVVECFTGPNIKAVHSMLINKPPDSGALTSRHPLHQDLHYFPFRPAERIVAAWTALEDVTIDNGCLIVIPGSHTRPLLQHEYPEWEGGVNKAYHGIRDCDYNEVVPLCMKKGETVFFHPLLIHGSGSNITKGFRKAISCHYAASNCYYIDVRGTFQENIAKEVEEMAKKKGFGSEVSVGAVFTGCPLSTFGTTNTSVQLSTCPEEDVLISKALAIRTRQTASEDGSYLQFQDVWRLKSRLVRGKEITL